MWNYEVRTIIMALFPLMATMVDCSEACNKVEPPSLPVAAPI